jgi:alkanesulfonate monooxygenase SsuD/methylene tetrahydromethanopterin reductase-like flavin-dependent oxidoreductase (luciferase family)
MPLSIVRFDMRLPAFAKTPRRELYAAALDMAAYADEHGFTSLVLSEHHGTDDGYLPAPLSLAGAMVGRTRRIPISIAALLVPLHDPLALAEQLAVLDLASGGRVAVTAGLGYRPEEYAAFGKDWKRRGALLDEALDTLLRAWTGEPFSYRGRTVRVTPRPASEPHPLLMVGGLSAAAARRAARFGLPFQPSSDAQELVDVYQQECKRRGVTNGFVVRPGRGETTFLAEDPERAWAELGPHLLHDARTYASWQQPGQVTAVHSKASTAEELRAEGKYRILTPEQCVAEAKAAGPLAAVVLFPLCGGAPPALGWQSLELYATRVLPKLQS